MENSVKQGGMDEYDTMDIGQQPCPQSPNANEAQEARRLKTMLLLILNMALQTMLIAVDNANNTVHRNARTSVNYILSFKVFLQLAISWKSFVPKRSLVSKRIWRISRSSPFVDQQILGSHNDKEFRRRVRVNPSTFYYICSLVAPSMQKDKRGGGIPLETRVALSLTRLGTGNYLLGCADLFGMSEGLASIVVRDFCAALLQYIRPLVVPVWNTKSLEKIAAAFQAKHDIPYIMGAIDGSHIPIIAPTVDQRVFYNRKGFYSVLLQGIVDVDTLFWDWDFGWCGSLHDYTMFMNSTEGAKVMAGFYGPYKLIGDVAYPHRTCMWVPFKGTKETLAPDRAHWNFIQSSTCMAVERAFGVLEGRWCILLRRIEMRTKNLPSLVGACICLHNLCVKHHDFIDDAMVQEAKKWLQKQHIQSFNDLKDAGTMRIFDYNKEDLQRVNIDVEELVRQNSIADAQDHPTEVNRASTASDTNALQAGVTMHRQMALNLYNRHLKRDAPLEPIFFESESGSDGEEQLKDWILSVLLQNKRYSCDPGPRNGMLMGTRLNRKPHVELSVCANYIGTDGNFHEDRKMGQTFAECIFDTTVMSCNVDSNYSVARKLESKCLLKACRSMTVVSSEVKLHP